MKLSLLAVLLLSGCALSPERAKQMTSYDLCSNLAAPLHPSEGKANAYAELKSRGENCDAYMPAIQVANQTRANNAALGLAIMSQANQPKQQTCVGQFVGTMWQEVCR